MSGGKKDGFTSSELEFCKLMALEGLGAIKAARLAFGWDCESGTKEYQKARYLATTPRILNKIEELKNSAVQQAEAAKILTTSATVDYENLRSFVYKKLEAFRDDPELSAQSKFKAIEALEQLADPSRDTNLIFKWLDIIMRGMTAHCPCCHETFPSEELNIPKLKEYRNNTNTYSVGPIDELYERRLEIIKLADKRNEPGKDQIRALSAYERHLVFKGAARSGKSYVMALLSLLYFLTPGTEAWILARIYDDARTEMEYMETFIEALFYPHARFLVKKLYDSKTNEWVMTSKWGSEIRIKSAKALGSLTARELDAVFAAEPGWLPENIYNHIRARLSSRLGRIFAFGTPQNLGGFLSRLIHTTGRDPKTKKMRRISAEERLLENGSPWGLSTMVGELRPENNPAYVKSELETARQELSDEEYASEFEGREVSSEGMKFNAIGQSHLIAVDRNIVTNASWVFGVDQGEKNFGGCLIAFDGVTCYVMKDFFEGEFNTIRTNLLDLRKQVPIWINGLTGDISKWKLTIFDQDPPLHNTLDEMDQEGMGWPTDYTFRHDNKKINGLSEDWRKDVTMFINDMAKEGKLLFDLECSQLHDEIMRTENVIKANIFSDTERKGKGWKISGSFRKDHVVDAWLLAMWTIFSKQVHAAKERKYSMEPMEEAKRAFEYQLRVDEERELKGKKNPNEIFSEVFGRPRDSADEVPFNNSVYHYKDY